MHLCLQNTVEQYKSTTTNLLVLFIPALYRAEWLLKAKFLLCEAHTDLF